MTAGRIYRELWWTNQEFLQVDIIPPGDEQQAG
jgi:hypothetical protein